MDKIESYVYFKERLAGYLRKEENIFVFQYDKKYLKLKDSTPISWNFPLQNSPFTANTLFPFFEGLVAEGWFLDAQSKIQKIDKTDYFSLLLENGADLIGAVTIKKV